MVFTMVKILLIGMMVFASCAMGAPEVARDISYAGRESGPFQKLDVHVPERDVEGLRPVMVLIHGGGWAKGDKARKDFMEPKTSWLLDAGYVVVSVNYRLSPAVRHPAHVNDVCTAIAWVQKSIRTYGGDPEKIYLLGHSAGAHLAALAGVDRRYQMAAEVDRSGIAGVILLDGAGYDIPRQVSGMRRISLMRKMYREAFTLNPAVQRRASPVFQVTSKPPPFLILHVARRADSGEQARLLAEALRAKGGRVEVISVPGESHRTINVDCGKRGEQTTMAIEKFLKSF